MENNIRLYLFENGKNRSKIIQVTFMHFYFFMQVRNIAITTSTVPARNTMNGNIGMLFGDVFSKITSS